MVLLGVVRAGAVKFVPEEVAQMLLALFDPRAMVVPVTEETLDVFVLPAPPPATFPALELTLAQPELAPAVAGTAATATAAAAALDAVCEMAAAVSAPAVEPDDVGRGAPAVTAEATAQGSSVAC